MVFKSEFFLRFDQADPGGVIFFAKALEISHEVFEEFVVNGLNLPWNEWFQNPNWVIPIVHCSADFRSPLLPGKRYSVELAITEIKATSFAIRMGFLDKDQRAIETHLVSVFLDRATRQKFEIPKGIREKLSHFLSSNLV